MFINQHSTKLEAVASLFAFIHTHAILLCIFFMFAPLSVSIAAQTTAAQTTTTLSDILEQAAYQQDTANDPERAIELYRQVIQSEKATRKMAAQAMYNAGLCYAKLKRNSEADQAFGAVVSQYKDVEPYYGLADAQLNPKFTPTFPRWQDGERLEYEIRDSTKVVGHYWTTTTKANWNGRTVWKVLNRSLGNNGLSMVIADDKTFRPLYGRADNGLGHATATWTDSSVKTSVDNQERTTDLKGVVYDAEQNFWLFRQISMTVGSKIKYQLLSTLSPEATIPYKVEVTGDEQIEVPAGKFAAYKLTAQGVASVWIDKSPERYVLKIGSPGSDSGFQLKRISRVTPNTWRTVTSSISSFGISIPDEWFNATDMRERKYSGTKKVNGKIEGSQITVPQEDIGILDDDMKVRLRIYVGDTKPLQEFDDIDLSLAGRVSDAIVQLQKNLSKYAVQEGSNVDRVIANLPARSFLADYEEGGKAWVNYSTYVKHDTKGVWIGFFTPKENFNEAKAVIDGILRTVTF
jgi:hypothetical protein